jgi:hypothetical protein
MPSDSRVGGSYKFPCIDLHDIRCPDVQGISILNPSSHFRYVYRKYFDL